MGIILSPDTLISSIEGLGIEIPTPLTIDDNADPGKLHAGFVEQFDRLVPIDESVSSDPTRERIYGPTNHPEAPRRIGDIKKAIKNNGLTLSLSNVNYFSDESDSYSDYASWRHYRSTTMGLSIPIERGIVKISLAGLLSSGEAGSKHEDFDGIKGYKDKEDSPELWADWEAKVSETNSIEADFGALMQTIGIRTDESPKKKETKLTLKTKGEFTDIDLSRAIGIGTALLKNVEPEMLKK